MKKFGRPICLFGTDFTITFARFRAPTFPYWEAFQAFDSVQPLQALHSRIDDAITERPRGRR